MLGSSECGGSHKITPHHCKCCPGGLAGIPEALWCSCRRRRSYLLWSPRDRPSICMQRATIDHNRCRGERSVCKRSSHAWPWSYGYKSLPLYDAGAEYVGFLPTGEGGGGVITGNTRSQVVAFRQWVGESMRC